MSDDDFSSNGPAAAERAREAWTTTKEQSVKAITKGGEILGANPIPSIVGALLVGLLVGILLRRPEPEPEKSLEKSIRDLREYLRPLASWATRNVEQGGDKAAEAAHGLADRIRGKLKLFKI